MPLQDRIGPLQGVAVAVVDSEADETPSEIPFRQAAMHLVEADKVEARTPQVPDHVLQEARRHLEQPVGLEPVEPGRPHVVEGEDGADSGDEWPQNEVGAAEIERFEAAADDRFLQAAQCPNPPFNTGKYPNSLLIIVCQGRRLDRRKGRRGCLGRAFGMDAAVSYHPGRESVVPAKTRHAGTVVKVEVFEDMPAAKPFWRRLEDGHALTTPYQRFDLLAAWQHHVGAPAGVRPFIITGFDTAGEPLFLWPFGRRNIGPLGLVKFLGSKHANFNVGLWRRDIVTAIGAPDIRVIFDRVAAGGHRVDLAALLSQPLSWDGIANPFLLLPHQAAVDVSARHHFNPPTDEVIEQVLSSSMRAR